MDSVIAAFNHAADGRLTATHAEMVSDRGLGRRAVRLRIAGRRDNGQPFDLTSLPIAQSGDAVSVAASLASTARGYVDVRATAENTASIIRKSSMTAKAQGLGTAFTGLMERLDKIASDATKTVDEAITRFETSAKTNATGVAKTIDKARENFEDKINRMTNGPPDPLDGTADSSPQSSAQVRSGDA